MELERTWKTALAEIELSVSKATFQTHFAQAQLVSIVEGVATIGFPSALMRSLVESRYYSLVKSVLDHVTKQNTSLVFTVTPKRDVVSAKNAGPLFSQLQDGAEEQFSRIAKRIHIDPERTFDNFAVSPSNQMAYAAATAVARSPGTAYNPLFLYGGVGVGKTHLMHAVANSVLSRSPSLRVVYCMGEEFTNEIVEAIQTKTNRQFRQKYRSSQLFLVDDVQFIAGKTQTQEEFFHTFNAVHREGGQVILTSDRPPAEIQKLEDRLRSRFEGGLTVDVAPPDFELRVAIVNIKSRALGINVPGDAAQLVAANITDTRALEGFLRRLKTETETNRSQITPEMVSSILRIKEDGTKGGGPALKRVSPQEALEAVAGYFNIKPTALKGPKRDRPIVRPRQLFMYICRSELGLTHEDIGGLLGGRDHTTIMHGVDTITKELSTNETLRRSLEGIKQKIWP